jgi:hypothetical protein
MCDSFIFTNTCTTSVVLVLVKIKLLLDDKMHDEYNVKFGNAQQAKVIHNCRRIKENVVHVLVKIKLLLKDKMHDEYNVKMAMPNRQK